MVIIMLSLISVYIIYIGFKKTYGTGYLITEHIQWFMNQLVEWRFAKH